MSDTSHDILDLLPEPHRTLAKQRRADAAHEAQTANSSIPRHLRIALASATRAFQSGDLSTLGTANEDLQPLLDAAIAWGRRQAKAPPALPFEARALARFYTTDTTQEFWRCLACGCEWPCDIVTACANCYGPKEKP